MKLQVFVALASELVLVGLTALHFCCHFQLNIDNVCKDTKKLITARETTLGFYPSLWTVYLVFVQLLSLLIVGAEVFEITQDSINWMICYGVVISSCWESLFSYHRYAQLKQYFERGRRMKTSSVLRRFSGFASVYIVLFVCQLRFVYWMFPLTIMLYAICNLFWQWHFIKLLIKQYSHIIDLDSVAASSIQRAMVRSAYVMGYCSMASTVIATLVVFSLSIFGSFDTNLFPAHSHLHLYHMVSLYFPTFWACSAFFYGFNFARNRSFFAAKFRALVHYNDSIDHHHSSLHHAMNLSVNRLKPPSASPATLNSPATDIPSLPPTTIGDGAHRPRMHAGNPSLMVLPPTIKETLTSVPSLPTLPITDDTSSQKIRSPTASTSIHSNHINPLFFLKPKMLNSKMFTVAVPVPSVPNGNDLKSKGFPSTKVEANISSESPLKTKSTERTTTTDNTISGIGSGNTRKTTTEISTIDSIYAVNPRNVAQALALNPLDLDGKEASMKRSKLKKDVLNNGGIITTRHPPPAEILYLTQAYHSSSNSNHNGKGNGRNNIGKNDSAEDSTSNELKSPKSVNTVNGYVLRLNHKDRTRGSNTVTTTNTNDEPSKSTLSPVGMTHIVPSGNPPNMNNLAYLHEDDEYVVPKSSLRQINILGDSRLDRDRAGHLLHKSLKGHDVSSHSEQTMPSKYASPDAPRRSHRSMSNPPRLWSRHDQRLQEQQQIQHHQQSHHQHGIYQHGQSHGHHLQPHQLPSIPPIRHVSPREMPDDVGAAFAKMPHEQGGQVGGGQGQHHPLHPPRSRTHTIPPRISSSVPPQRVHKSPVFPQYIKRNGVNGGNRVNAVNGNRVVLPRDQRESKFSSDRRNGLHNGAHPRYHQSRYSFNPFVHNATYPVAKVAKPRRFASRSQDPSSSTPNLNSNQMSSDPSNQIPVDAEYDDNHEHHGVTYPPARYGVINRGPRIGGGRYYNQYRNHPNHRNGNGIPFVFRETDSLPHQTESECTSSIHYGRDGRDDDRDLIDRDHLHLDERRTSSFTSSSSNSSGTETGTTGTEMKEGSGVVIERTTSEETEMKNEHPRDREVEIELVHIGDMSPDHSADSISNDPSNCNEMRMINGGSETDSPRGFGRKHTLIPSTTDDYCDDEEDSDIDERERDRREHDRGDGVKAIPLALEHSKSMTLVGMMVNSGFTDPGLANSLQELSRMATA